MAVTAVASSSRTRWRAARLAWVLWALAIVGLVVTVWLDQLLGQTGRPELVVLIRTTDYCPSDPLWNKLVRIQRSSSSCGWNGW